MKNLEQMENKQTAVEWLMENLHTAKDPFKQAKEIEKQQIIDAYESSHVSMMTSEQYYNETYK